MAKKESFHIMAHWPSRHEALPIAAERVAALFACLSGIDPILTHWAASHNGEGRVMTPDVITQMHADRLANNSFAPLNKNLFMMVHSAVVGYWVNVTVVWRLSPLEQPTFDHINLSISQKDETAALLTTPTITKMVQCVVDAIEPEWVSVRTERLMYMKSQRRGPHPDIGWITYLKNPSQPLPAFSSPSHAESYGQGVLITATDELFIRQNPAHMAAIDQIDAALVSAGIFDPGTFTDMDALAKTPGVKIITLTNSSQEEIDFGIEPLGMYFPMPPGAEFKVADYGKVEFEIVEEHDPDGGSIVINLETFELEPPLGVYYNGVILFGE